MPQPEYPTHLSIAKKLDLKAKARSCCFEELESFGAGFLKRDHRPRISLSMSFWRSTYALEDSIGEMEREQDHANMGWILDFEHRPRTGKYISRTTYNFFYLGLESHSPSDSLSFVSRPT
jgi:hypothetical protein